MFITVLTSIVPTLNHWDNTQNIFLWVAYRFTNGQGKIKWCQNVFLGEISFLYCQRFAHQPQVKYIFGHEMQTRTCCFCLPACLVCLNRKSLIIGYVTDQTAMCSSQSMWSLIFTYSHNRSTRVNEGFGTHQFQLTKPYGNFQHN